MAVRRRSIAGACRARRVLEHALAGANRVESLYAVVYTRGVRAWEAGYLGRHAHAPRPRSRPVSVSLEAARLCLRRPLSAAAASGADASVTGAKLAYGLGRLVRGARPGIYAHGRYSADLGRSSPLLASSKGQGDLPRPRWCVRAARRATEERLLTRMQLKYPGKTQLEHCA